MLDPAGTYRELAGHPLPPGALAALRRPLFLALILGVVAALSSTGRLTLGLVASSTVCWSFVPAVQLVSLMVVLAAIGHPRVSWAQAVDLFFAGQGPWSLWMLTVAAAAAAGFPEGSAAWPGALTSLVLASAIVPAVWTAVITAAFFREGIALPPRRARAATALYTALVWTVAVAYFCVVIQVWPRVVGVL